MTDEAKALVDLLRTPGIGAKWGPPPFEDAADLIEAQAREIERLRGALELADAALSGANMNMNVVKRKVRAALGEKQ